MDRRQRNRPAVGQKDGAAVILHGLFIKRYANCLLGIQQRVEMTPWHM